MKADGRQVVAERTHRETLTRDQVAENSEDPGSADVPSLFKRARFSTFMEAGPGRFIVEINLEDLSSGKSSRKELVFELPARNRPLIATDLRLETRTGMPIVELSVPDTLVERRAVTYVTGNVRRPILLHYDLTRLVSDTAAAQAPFWQGPGSGFSGLNPRPMPVSDTLASERSVVDRGPLRRVSFVVPAVERGVYRASVAIEDLENEGDPPAVVRDRYFVVRRSDFPRISSYDELIPPLIYLADAQEWEALRSATDAAEARRRFDGFWGRWMQDRSLAARVVQTYFSRVEEANLRYSTFREGWKTDRGMVYIILGEPLFIERTLESEIWYYSYDEGRGERTFVFNRVWREEAPEIIEEFRLDRSFEYERFWRAEVSKWRAGNVS
jgi:GWxTD domain-containing protein